MSVGCEFDIIPGVIAPMDTEIGVQRCDECDTYEGDLEAAYALAQIVGGVVKFWNDSPREIRTFTGVYNPADVMVSGCEAADIDKNPWVEVDGTPYDWNNFAFHDYQRNGA